MLTKSQAAAVSGLAVAALNALVAFGVLGGEQANALQAVSIAAVTFIAAFAIRSGRKPTELPGPIFMCGTVGDAAEPATAPKSDSPAES